MDHVIRAISVEEVFDSPVFAALVEEYRAESLRNPSMLGTQPDRETYVKLVGAGVMHPLGAFSGDELVGIATVMVSGVPHYAGRLLATTETLFVANKHRAGGAGMKLLRAAEEVAAMLGAEGLYVTVPVGGRLESILPRAGYAETNRVFYRERNAWH